MCVCVLCVCPSSRKEDIAECALAYKRVVIEPTHLRTQHLKFIRVFFQLLYAVFVLFSPFHGLFLFSIYSPLACEHRIKSKTYTLVSCVCVWLNEHARSIKNIYFDSLAAMTKRNKRRDESTLPIVPERSSRSISVPDRLLSTYGRIRCIDCKRCNATSANTFNTGFTETTQTRTTSDYNHNNFKHTTNKSF